MVTHFISLRQLTISPSTGSFPVRDERFGRGEGSILLDGSLACNGTEDNLFACKKDSTVSCPGDHSEDAGVRCASKYWFIVVTDFMFLVDGIH